MKQDYYSKDRLKIVRKGQGEDEGKLMIKPSTPDSQKMMNEAQDCLDTLAHASDQWIKITASLSEKDMTNLARDIVNKNQTDKKALKKIDTKGLGLNLGKAPSKTKFGKNKSYEVSSSSEEGSPVVERKIQLPATQNSASASCSAHSHKEKLP